MVVEGGITEDGYLFIDNRQDTKATQVLSACQDGRCVYCGVFRLSSMLLEQRQLWSLKADDLYLFVKV